MASTTTEFYCGPKKGNRTPVFHRASGGTFVGHVWESDGPGMGWRYRTPHMDHRSKESFRFRKGAILAMAKKV